MRIFLYLKIEDQREPYPDIVPAFAPRRRLKIGTFKVELNGFKVGERFLKVVFDNALVQRVDEIYVTIFPHSILQQRLIDLLEDFGFYPHGEKRNSYGTERVYVRDMTPRFNADDPCGTFPFIGRSAPVFLVPICPEYHTELLPDSILRTESPVDFIEQLLHRNAIRKVYVSRSIFRGLHPGNTIVFYRTGGKYKSVVTTLGIVEDVYIDIHDEEQFIRLCRQRSVFTDEELRKHWRYRPSTRPFVVDFLYALLLSQATKHGGPDRTWRHPGYRVSATGVRADHKRTVRNDSPALGDRSARCCQLGQNSSPRSFAVKSGTSSGARSSSVRSTLSSCTRRCRFVVLLLSSECRRSSATRRTLSGASHVRLRGSKSTRSSNTFAVKS